MKHKRKHKIKDDDENIGEPGTFRYAKQTRMTNPIEFYHMRLEYLKNKRMKRRLMKEKKEKKEL